MSKRKNKRIYILFIVVFLSISIGYAYLSQDLKLDTSIIIAPEKDTLLINQLINQAIEDTDITFGEISSDTNGKGVYKLTKIETSTPIYYYRGNVDNNNVIFGGFCWKMIRSTETGGIKIIYNGVPNNGVCDATGNATEIGKSAYNTQNNDEKYIGYMYDNNTVDSTIKGVVDTWFEENLLTYQNYLEDTPFYNERDYVDGISYPSMVRIWGSGNYAEAVPNTTIKLGATNPEDIFTVSNEKGNGALTYPVGLITSDEIIMAGGRGYISDSNLGTNNTYYLYSGSGFWSISPYGVHPSAHFAGVINNMTSYLGNTYTNYKSGVRPVVSLKTGTNYLSGDGTKESPYII